MSHTKSGESVSPTSTIGYQNEKNETLNSPNSPRDHKHIFRPDVDHPSVSLEPGVSTPVHPKLAPVASPEFKTDLQRQLTLKGVVTREKDIEKGGEYNVVTWEENDKENPRNWSKGKKFWTLAVVSNLCFGVAFGSAIITGDLTGMANHFHVSSEVINLTVALFVVGFGVGPIFYAPISESIGRKPIYFFSYFFYFIFTLPSALAQNIGTLIVSRALAGLFASAPMTNVGGTVADMFSLEDRGWPMTIFSGVIFVGPVFGPLVGGYIGETVGWRWIYWVLFIYVGISTCFVLTIPETFAPVLLKKRAKKLRKDTGDETYVSDLDLQKKGSLMLEIQTLVLRPCVMLVTEPILICFSAYLSLIYSLLYLFFFAFPIVFIEGHGFTDGQTGLTFLSILIGLLIGSSLTHFQNKWYTQIVAKRGEVPEARLPLMMIGCLVLPASLFVFGWTSFSYVHWIGPTMSGVLFGFAMITIYISANTYIVDCFPRYVASAMAAKTFARSICGASVPLWVNQMYHTLNPRWASTLLAFVSVAMLPIPFIFWRYGERIRKTSNRAD